MSTQPELEEIHTKLIPQPDEATYLLPEKGESKRGVGWLVVVSGHEPDTIYPLIVGETLVGRALGCEIQLVDKSVSRQHIKIQGELLPLQGYRYIAVDLNSANGLIVNRQRVSHAILEDEDYLQIGRFELIFKQVLFKNKPH